MSKEGVRTVFLEALSSGGRGYLTDWYEKELSAEAQAEFDAILINHGVMSRRLWGMPEFKPLGDGLFEFRFKVGGRQYRPLGYDGPGQNQFTFLVGASKKMKLWTPVDAQATAKRRRKEIAEGVRKVARYAEHLFTDVSKT